MTPRGLGAAHVSAQLRELVRNDLAAGRLYIDAVKGCPVEPENAFLIAVVQGRIAELLLNGFRNLQHLEGVYLPLG